MNKVREKFQIEQEFLHGDKKDKSLPNRCGFASPDDE
jgi:hypothetical protein